MSATSGAQRATLNKTAIKSGSTPLAERAMQSLSSVRFGVALLVVLVAACMVGMVIMQANMEGFDNYYAELTPSQKLLYGKLGFFDIYHTWFFNALLLVLSLNIVLSSIDNFPKAWTFISRPKLDATAHWLGGQEQHATLTVEGGDGETVAERVSAACRSLGLKATTTENGGRTFVFAERGAWNRLGAYAVHVALLVIFAGGFMTARYGHTGQVAFGPGESVSEMNETVFNLDKSQQISIALPFEVECIDIQQKLIDKAGPTSPTNTLDWLTRIRIKDTERGETEGVVQMNAPFDYRGYRFFQSSFVPEGKARTIRLRVTSATEGVEEISVMRDASAQLSDGTVVKFTGFFSDFVLNGGRGDSKSPEYVNPTAEIQVLGASGVADRGFVFPASAAAGPMVGRAIAGFKFELLDFEKVGAAHVLSVQKDPGANIVYLGFFLLVLTLAAVFMFSHQRVWALIEPSDVDGNHATRVMLGGNTNRNRIAFEDRFKRIVGELNGTEVKGL